MKVKIVVAGALLMLAQGAFAADNPWLGTWKLNAGKSSGTGAPLVITKTKSGFHFSTGSTAYDLVGDGSEHDLDEHHSASLQSAGGGVWLRLNRLDGKETGRVTYAIADGGTMLTIKTTGVREDDSRFENTVTAHREKASTNLAGVWQMDSNPASGEPAMRYSDAGDGRIRVEELATLREMTVTFDGKPVIMTGPSVSAGHTSTWQRVSDREWKFAAQADGKPEFEGTETLSPDGRVLTEIFWYGGKTDLKQTLVYEKQ